MSEYPDETPETATVELEMWQWKQILGKVRHDKHTVKSERGRKDSEHIEQSIKHQIEAQQDD